MEFGQQSIVAPDHGMLMQTHGGMDQRSLVILTGRNHDHLRAFTKQIAKQDTVVRVSHTAIKNPNDLTQILIEHSDAALIGKSSHLENQLQDIYSHLKTRRKKLALIFENAEELSVSVLATLAYLAYWQENRSTCIRILLQGTEKLSNKLQIFYGKDIPIIKLQDWAMQERKIKAEQMNPAMIHSYKKEFSLPIKKSTWVRGASIATLMVVGTIVHGVFHHTQHPFDAKLMAQHKNYVKNIHSV